MIRKRGELRFPAILSVFHGPLNSILISRTILHVSRSMLTVIVVFLSPESLLVTAAEISGNDVGSGVDAGPGVGVGSGVGDGFGDSA